MKKCVAFGMILMMTLAMVACGNKVDQTVETVRTETEMVIESEPADTEEREDLEDDVLSGAWSTWQGDEMPQEALDAFDQATDGLEGAVYEPVRLLASQIVGGTNYAILCKTVIVVPDAVEEYGIVYIYADLDGQAEIVDFTDFYINDDEEMSGGWMSVTDEAVADAALAALDKALEGLVGATYEPVAVIGSQSVAGTNYMILCKVTPVVPDAEGDYCLVSVYEDLEGQSEITDIQDLVF